jgi:hypothetical protein
MYESSTGYRQGKVILVDAQLEQVNIPGDNHWEGFSGIDYLYGLSSDFGMGTSNWTWECWFTLGSISYDTNVLFNSTTGVTDNGFLVTVNSVNLLIAHAGSGPGTGWDVGYMEGTTLLTFATWYHVAVVRQGNTWRLYLNGVQEDTANVSGKNFGTGAYMIAIGNELYGGNNDFLTGNIDKIRWCKTVVYPDGTSFTPPSRT